MKHTRVTIYPDCPMCGQELRETCKFDDRVDSTYPVGHRIGWWECTNCGYKSTPIEGRVKPETTETVESAEECEACTI